MSVKVLESKRIDGSSFIRKCRETLSDNSEVFSVNIFHNISEIVVFDCEDETQADVLYLNMSYCDITFSWG